MTESKVFTTMQIIEGGVETAAERALAFSDACVSGDHFKAKAIRQQMTDALSALDLLLQIAINARVQQMRTKRGSDA